MTEGAWYARRERGSAVGMRLLLAVWRVAGRHVAALLLDPVVLYFFLTGRTSRAASRDYLQRLHRFAPHVLGDAPRCRDVFRHFRSFARATIERVGFWDARGRVAVTATGLEHILRFTREGQGVLLLGSHLGSFDAMRRLAEESPVPVTMLMYTDHAENVNRLLRRLEPEGERPTRALEIRPGSFAHVLEARKSIDAGEIVAVLADRVAPDEASRARVVDFLGGKALLPEGPFRLAAALRCPVVTMRSLRDADGVYRVAVEPFVRRLELPPAQRKERLQQVCQEYARHLEAGCLAAPFQWFNFYPYFVDGADG